MKGIDIFHGDGKNGEYPLKPVPQKAFNDSDFVIVKATQGISYGHRDFLTRTIAAALKADKLIGVYHYAAGNDPVKEADYFLQVVKPYIGKAVLCLDWEHWINAAKGIPNHSWGSKTWCAKFINRVKEKTGITCVLYTGLDGIKQNAQLANKVPLWFAGYPDASYSGWTVPHFKYGVSPWSAWTIWQFTSSGEKVDRNTTPLTRSAWKDLARGTVQKKTEADVRKSVVSAISKFKGIKEGSLAHKRLIDIFNDSGLCTRYRMTEDDAWCAMTVSDAFIITALAGRPGSGALFQCVECSCAEMIKLAKKQGIWQEKDSYVPKVGDVIFYDWQDSGKGDNTGHPDHVGLVSSCDGKIIKVLEGNYKDSVGYREIKVNGKSIRGFICPKYGLYASGDKSTAEKDKEPQAKPQEARGYSGKFPELPARGYFKKGDGYLQLIGVKTEVRRLQKLTNWISGTHLQIDGAYGDKTIAAVKKAQKILGVKEDGLFGKETLKKAKAYKK